MYQVLSSVLKRNLASKKINLDEEMIEKIAQAIEKSRPYCYALKSPNPPLGYANVLFLIDIAFTPDMKKCAVIAEFDSIYDWLIFILEINHPAKEITKCDWYEPSIYQKPSLYLPRLVAINKNGVFFACVSRENLPRDENDLPIDDKVYLHLWKDLCSWNEEEHFYQWTKEWGEWDKEHWKRLARSSWIVPLKDAPEAMYPQEIHFEDYELYLDWEGGRIESMIENPNQFLGKTRQILEGKYRKKICVGLPSLPSKEALQVLKDLKESKKIIPKAFYKRIIFHDLTFEELKQMSSSARDFVEQIKIKCTHEIAGSQIEYEIRHRLSGSDIYLQSLTPLSYSNISQAENGIRRVREIVVKIAKGGPHWELTRRGDGIHGFSFDTTIFPQEKLTLERIKGFFDQYRKYFRNVKISEVHFVNVPKSASLRLPDKKMINSLSIIEAE